jgi:flagellar biosynthesis protein FlhA
MPAALTANSGLLQTFHRYRGMAFPIGSILLLFVILVPLPTQIMDVLLAMSLTISAIVLVTVMYVKRPLDFSVFPSLLLGLTLFRLVLNTATTRLILTNAKQGTAAAGHVVETFGNFVAGGSLAVGIIIFLIIFVIQFVVITKGATRIAEVAARFTLDGMPGKQMAIDADLNAGLIKEDEARRRRQEISQEADFYGAMDGASKFVRGDAIAGIIITMINILGGLYVGLVEEGFGLRQSLDVFTKLTIGDGLVSQIPAFIISVGAGMLVTRNTGQSNLGEEVLNQMTSQPTALFIAGGFLFVLMATPLPKGPLLFLGAGCTAVAVVLARGRTKAAAAQEAQVRAAQGQKSAEKIESYLSVDAMSLDVGYGLIKLVDRKQGGDLLDRISSIRRQVAQDFGLVVPPIRIRDQLRLEPNQYVVKMKGVEVGRGEALPGCCLAIDNGTASGSLPGVETREPAFGLKAYWVTDQNRAFAEQRNYTVVPASSVMATHLTELIKRSAASLLTRQETSRLVETLKERASKLVEEVIPDLLKLGDVQKVLQNLLRESVPIRDLETILETLGDWAARTKDIEVLTEYVRNALARQICQQYLADDGKLYCVSLDPALEDMIQAHVERSDRGSFLTMPVTMQRRIIEAIAAEIDRATTTSAGRTPVVLSSPQIRVTVRRLIEAAMPHAAVLGYNEVVSGIEVHSLGVAVLNHEPANVSSTVHA